MYLAKITNKFEDLSCQFLLSFAPWDTRNYAIFQLPIEIHALNRTQIKHNTYLKFGQFRYEVSEIIRHSLFILTCLLRSNLLVIGCESLLFLFSWDLFDSSSGESKKGPRGPSPFYIFGSKFFFIQISS